MPYEKIPIVHKFGIISHTQRLELQQRILKESYLESVASRRAEYTKNLFEVTEEFIQEYNSADSFDEQERYENKAHKILERIKRKVGLRAAGHGSHVDLPLAWTELSQLSQCKGVIQDECLDVMITSLDQAPLNRSQIPALFFLSETTLYWLRTDAVNQPYLRTGELKLLKMGMLVFMRLFYHHMAGHLQGHADFKTRLFTYLDGFADCQYAYSPYPNALLCIRFVNEVGRMIIGDVALDHENMKETDTNSEASNNVHRGNKERQSNPSDNNSEYFREVSANYEDVSHSSQTGAISSSVHDLSPTLWHALDVWRCIRRTLVGMQDALSALSSCGMGLASESWIDGVVAMQILSDAAKSDVKILRTLQNLAKGVEPKTRGHHSSDDADTIAASGSINTQDKSHTTKTSRSSNPTSSKFGLSDIYEKTEYDSSHSKSNGRSGHTRSQKCRDDMESVTPGLESPLKSGCKTATHSSRNTCPHEKGIRSPTKSVSASPDKSTRSPDKANRSPDKDGPRLMSRDKTYETNQTDTTQSRLQTGESGWQAELNTDGRASQASSVPTYSNKWNIELPGIHGWHWEVAITYADILSDVVLHATSSNIVKVALMGNNSDNNTELDRITNVACCPMKSAGLLDLVFFKAVDESNDEGSNDWSWRVRYSAIQGLVKICRCCTGDSTKEGTRTVAWNSLIRAHSLERDKRVLEALKVGQVDANIENLLSKHLTVIPGTIGAKVSAGLSSIYLPPIQPPVQLTLPKKRSVNVIHVNKPLPRRPQRTTLRDEIKLATALYEPPVTFAAKSNFDLRRVIEDQWRKELQVELDDAEERRVKLLEEEQQDQEHLERIRQETRKIKLKEGIYKLLPVCFDVKAGILLCHSHRPQHQETVDKNMLDVSRDVSGRCSHCSSGRNSASSNYAS